MEQKSPYTMIKNTKKVLLTFCGGTGSVTGANFLLHGERINVLVDCGLEQGSRFAEAANREPFPYDPAAIQYLLVTHAHIDHIGRIPKLIRDGFNGKIISTAETKALSELMFPDALSVMRGEAKNGEEPLYDERDISNALSLWETIPYHTPLLLGDEFEVVLKDAGHILGSAMFHITYTDRRRFKDAQINADGGAEQTRKRSIVFTGDLGNSPSPLLRDTEAITDATYIVMESVYGDRNHEGEEMRREKLAEIINAAIKRGGTLLIPCFSLEKTQVILHEMNDLLLAKKIPSVPVFLDSPLAIRVTQVYRRMSENWNDEAKRQLAGGDDPFDFPRLTLTPQALDSNEIMRTPNPKIIIAGSGMSAGGRIQGHERAHLSDSRNTILFVGYQAAGSLGRMIQEGMKQVEINEERIALRARVETIIGYSSHKDSEHLLKFVERAAEGGTLKKVFTVMGEPRASLFLAQRIRDYIGVEAVVPEKGDKVEIQL